MRIFVTGSTGFIGSVVVQELLAAGHSVLGLVRSDANAAALAALGATAVRGSLEDLAILRHGAEQADGVIHTAFVHDFANFAASCATDQAAIRAIGDVLAGSGRPFAITSGTPIVAGRVATEADVGDRSGPVSSLRAPAEDVALALADRGVRASIVRLPRSVHGASDRGWLGGLIILLLEVIRAKGVSAYVGDGQQRWPAVHRLDAARLYRLAIEHAPAGSRLHATDEDGVTLRDIAEALGRQLGVPVEARSPADAMAHFGFAASAASTDQPASSAQTRALLGWAPREAKLLADLAAHLVP
ncbi:MAG TPA: SDR family oxidoreductase [Kofleriaceae bacterium]|jgi:nucleoside-diphosphate-sugar epimerase